MVAADLIRANEIIAEQRLVGREHATARSGRLEPGASHKSLWQNFVNTEKAHFRRDSQSKGREALLNESLQYICSDQALRSLQLDPYWPKWHSPWWHMMLLDELGLAERIPTKALQMLVKSLEGYLDYFPISEAEVPPDKDPLAHFMCHCQLGCLYQLLAHANAEVQRIIPFARSWFVKYQLPDGGYNCDEAVYTRANPRSSMVSTLPVLESLLVIAEKDATNEEFEALDRGAQYVLERHLFRSISRKGAIIDESWTKLLFPRFYEYDLLRGLAFVVSWALIRRKTLPLSGISEALVLLRDKLQNNSCRVERQIYSGSSGSKTRVRHSDGTWSRTDASNFALLSATSELNAISPFLTHSWQSTIDGLAELESCGLLSQEPDQ
jgi:hypothetical protein